ncbi:MAG: DUF4363 family protein [Oscillospiraceae bacterium]|nr:DUF4363 family protein [Oscillospiraceae bacterium]
MKSVIISIVIAVAVVAGSIVYTNNLEKVSEDLRGINREVSQCLKDEDFAGADLKIEQLTAYLNRKRALLDATGDHEEMDQIEMNISELAEFSRGGQKADALSKTRVLDFLFEHLPLNYKLKLENIL